MKKIITIMLMLTLCVGMSGCSLLKNEIAERKSKREYCTLNEKDATVFTCGGTEYVILQDTVEKDTLGAWVGYIQKLAALNKKCAVLELWELNLSEASTKELPFDTAYVIQYLNIYQNSKDNQELIIDVNGGFHKAIPKAQADDAVSVIRFEEAQAEPAGDITINVNNCTQLLYGSSVYQITETAISKNELDTYLSVIGTNKVFDSRTNLEIPRSDLKKVEIEPGELSKQERIDWTYGTVFSIVNIDKSQSIAVEINNQYLRADMVQ